MSSGSPPTLWWLLITAAVPSLPPDSMRSGYSVPWTRNSASDRPPVCSSKMRMNSSPIALRFSSGSTIPCQPVEEPVGGVDVDQLDTHVAAERLGDLGALAEAHQPGVDVDARQVVADRPVHESGGDGGVDSAGQGTDRPPVPDLLADAGDLLVGHRRHRPRRGATGSFDEEAAQHGHAVRRVDDLRMELHAVDPSLVVLEHDDGGVVRRRRGDEAGWCPGDRVEVAHPHVVHVGRLVGQQRATVLCDAGWCVRTRRAAPVRRNRRAAGR